VPESAAARSLGVSALTLAMFGSLLESSARLKLR